LKVFGSAGHRAFHLLAASRWLQPWAKRKEQRAFTPYWRLKAAATSDQVFPCWRRLSESRSCSCLTLRICPGIVLIPLPLADRASQSLLANGTSLLNGEILQLKILASWGGLRAASAAEFASWSCMNDVRSEA
jgi:hypothetical protein